tara:strand:+ start:108 stop:476 length:369 start_codon:yes stop_codon:yes gene_type:complete
MPIYKTEILGSLIEIDYVEEDKNKLEIAIDNFKKRLFSFKSLEGKVSDKKILILAGIKAEDNAINQISVKEIIKLKDKIQSLSEQNAKHEDTNNDAIEKLEKLEKKISKLTDLNIKFNDDVN